MRKEWLQQAAMYTLVLCAVAVTALVVRRELFSGELVSMVAPPNAPLVDDWATYAAAGHRMGPEGAPVTLVEFSDFQCPACRVLASSVDTLRARYGDRVQVIYRHFPLKSHLHAVAAARASECAAAQGRFEAFHDVLFAAQDSIGLVPWTRLARSAAVPALSAFEACAAETGPIPSLARDTVAGLRLGVSSTPTLLINGRRVVGAPPLTTLDAFVRQELRAARGRTD
jgi:protein-disulfide isomerase